VADFDCGDLDGAIRLGSNLKGANLGGAHWEEANLGCAHLAGAKLQGAHLEGTILSGAHLEGAILIGAHLEKADITDAHLIGANLWEAYLAGAILLDAHLEKAVLSFAHLERANLSGAHLAGVNLWEAHLEGAELRNTSGTPADRRGAQLTAETCIRSGWSAAQISEWLRAGAVLPNEEINKLLEETRSRLLREVEGLTMYFDHLLNPGERILIDVVIANTLQEYPETTCEVVEYINQGECSLVRLRSNHLNHLLLIARFIQQEIRAGKGQPPAAETAIVKEATGALQLAGLLGAVWRPVQRLFHGLTKIRLVYDGEQLELKRQLAEFERRLQQVEGRPTYHIEVKEGGQAGAIGAGASASGNTFQQNREEEP